MSSQTPPYMASMCLAAYSNFVINGANLNDFIIFTGNTNQQILFGVSNYNPNMAITSGNSGNVNFCINAVANSNVTVCNMLNTSNILITGTSCNIGDENLNNLNVTGASMMGSNLTLNNNTGSVTLFSYGANLGINQALPSYMLQVGGSIFSSGDVTALSDARFKTNVKRLENSLDTLCQLNGYSFNRVDLEDHDKLHIGLIAQEVEKVIPSVVDYDKANDVYSIKYGNTVAVIIEAVKEMRQELNDLKGLYYKSLGASI